MISESVRLVSEHLWQQQGLKHKAASWTPGLSSSDDHSGDSLDRNGGSTHRVDAHTRGEKGIESDRAGQPHLPMTKDKHRADTNSRQVYSARRRKTGKEGPR